MIHTNEAASALGCARKAILQRQNRAENHDFSLPDGQQYRKKLEEWLSPFQMPNGKTGDTSQRSLELLAAHKAGRNLRFESHSIRTAIPLIAADPDSSAQDPRYIVWYPVYGIAPREGMLNRMYADAAVLSQCGIELSDIRTICLKQDLITADHQSPEEIFEIHRHFKKTRGGWRRNSIIEMVEELKAKEPFESFLELVHSFFASHNEDEPGAPELAARKTRVCSNPRCAFYDECFHENELPDNSAQMLFSSHFHEEFEKQGIQRLAQVDGEHLEGSLMQYAQILADRSLLEQQNSSLADSENEPETEAAYKQAVNHSAADQQHASDPAAVNQITDERTAAYQDQKQEMKKTPEGVFIDKPAIEYWFNSLEYPLSYLDFEWDTFVLSPYPGMKPLDVLCFQYSLHVEQEDGSMEHTAFFETGDCRVNFIESLIDDLPDTGSILVFNMEGAERLRLMQLASQFEQYRKPLEEICSRMVDLAVPFESGCYYDIRQRSHSSLKTLLPLFTDSVTYHSLEVGNGVQAVSAYRQVCAQKKEEQLALARAISDYCSVDTIAEKALLDGLKLKLEAKSCQT